VPYEPSTPEPSTPEPSTPEPSAPEPFLLARRAEEFRPMMWALFVVAAGLLALQAST